MRNLALLYSVLVICISATLRHREPLETIAVTDPHAGLESQGRAYGGSKGIVGDTAASLP